MWAWIKQAIARWIVSETCVENDAGALVAIASLPDCELIFQSHEKDSGIGAPAGVAGSSRPGRAR